MSFRPRVLIVEDEPDMLLLLRINLEQAGFEASLAADGATAMRRIAAERPDVVLLDLKLPVLDGWAVLADLHSREHAPPVIVCSAKGTARDLARASELGAVLARPGRSQGDDLARAALAPWLEVVPRANLLVELVSHRLSQTSNPSGAGWGPGTTPHAARLARSLGIKEVIQCRNGELVRLAEGRAGIIDEVPAGRIYKDGNLLEDSKSRAVVERRRMGFAGCAFVAIAMTDKGELADDPEVDLVGIPEKNAAGEVIDEIVFDAVVSTVENLPRARRRDADATAESVRRAVRAVINENWGKKPICLVHVLTV